MGLFLWALAAAFFLCAPFLFFHGLSAATQKLDARVASAAQARLVPEIRQRSIPKPLITAVKGLLQRQDLGLKYITLRNADRVILIADGTLEDALDWLSASQSRRWRSFLYHASSSDRSLTLRESGEIVGYIDYGIATSHVLAALPLTVWLVILSDMAALALLFILFPVVIGFVQARLTTGTAAKPAPRARTERTKPSTPKTGARELQLSDRLGIGFIAVDAQGVIAKANTNAARLLGFELRALTGQNVQSLMVLEDGQGQSLDTPLQRCLGGERRSVRAQAWLRRRDGKLLGLEMHAGPAAAGNAAAGMLFWEASEDMTARRRDSEQASLAQTLLQQTHDAVLLTDKAGKVLHANPQAADLFGIPAKELKAMALAKLLPQPFAEAPLAKLPATAGTGIASDGKTIKLNITCASLRWQGRPAFMLFLQARHGQAAPVGSAPRAAPDVLPAMLYHDSLTGLASRQYLMQQLANRLAADRSVDPCLLLLVDIIDFKKVNLNFGREVGDQALAAFGQNILAVLAPGDIAVRFGGEEFAVLLCSEHIDEQYAQAQAQALLQACQRPLKLEQMELPLQVHIGMSAAPLDADSPEQMVQHAEAALYTAKAHTQAGGGADPVLYAPGMELAVSDTPEAQALYRALASNALSLRFHALCHASEEAPLAAGLAVISWRVSKDVSYNEDALWREANNADMTQALAAWCLRRVAQWLAEWRDMGLAPVPVCVAFPLAVMQSQQFARNYTAITARNNLPDGLLILRSLQAGAHGLPQELAASVRCAQIMPPDALEPTSADFLQLPSEVVAGLPDHEPAIAAAKALGAFGRKHGKPVWAGPVETKAQRSVLIAMDIGLMYGPLIAPALAPRPFARRLAQHKTAPI